MIPTKLKTTGVAPTSKKLLEKMSDEDKLAFISAGAHIAHSWPINYSEAWKIDLTRTAELKRDASNFFEIAERV